MVHKIKKSHLEKIQEIERNNKFLSLQSSSLLNQMKPHFIFNALAPLQNYIYTSNKDAGIKYLTTISKLLRNMLNHSRENYVTIESELEFINLYLTQQQIEKNNSFEFEIQNTITVKNLKIPSLLIQPLLENCIEHGLSDTNKGYIKLSFENTNPDYIKISIHENGIGFDLEKNMKYNKNSALNIVYERIQLLKKASNSINTAIESTKTENLFNIYLILPINI
jgi:sensor histidine kinase YesM